MIYNTIIIQGGLLTMSVRYNEDFKLEVVKAYMAGDRSTAELSAEYNVAKSTILDWAKKYSDECHYKNTTSKNSEADAAKEIRRLNQQLKEKDKEIEFLKKAAAFFAKEIDWWYIVSLTIIKIILA